MQSHALRLSECKSMDSVASLPFASTSSSFLAAYYECNRLSSGYGWRDVMLQSSCSSCSPPVIQRGQEHQHLDTGQPKLSCYMQMRGSAFKIWRCCCWISQIVLQIIDFNGGSWQITHGHTSRPGAVQCSVSMLHPCWTTANCGFINVPRIHQKQHPPKFAICYSG